MTVSNTSVVSTYDGNGSTTTFPYYFQTQQNTDVAVYLAGTLQSVGYVVQPNSNLVGGNVVFTAAPPVGTGNVILRLLTPITQTTTLPTESPLPEATLEAMVDHVVMICQQLQEQVNRTLGVALGSNLAGVSLIAAPPQASMLLGWNAAGTALTNYSIAAAGLVGNVSGPNTSTAYGLAYFAGTTGALLASSGVGTTGQVWTSNGPGAPGSFQALPGSTTVDGLFRPHNITSSARALPTSGALSGTYVHNGNWTQTDNITFAHGTRIYLNGNFTTLAGKTFAGVAQNNNGVNVATCVSQVGVNGGGLNGGQGGFGPAACGGGNGGGSAGAGGCGGVGKAKYSYGLNGVNTVFGAGGGGGGSGGGDGATFIGAPGGGGGPALLVEVYGNVDIEGIMSADGAAGGAYTVGVYANGGGGGGGGQITMRNTGSFTVGAAGAIYCRGGAGGAGAAVPTTTAGNKGGPGGGGFLEIMTAAASIAVTAGGVCSASSVVAGVAGAGAGASLSAATAAGNGVYTPYVSMSPISL